MKETCAYRTHRILALASLALLSACASPQSHASAESTRASLDAPAAQAVHAAPAVPTGHSPDEDLRVQPRQDHVPPEYRCAPIALDRARLDEIAAERAFFGGLVDQMVADGELPPPSGRTRVRTDEPVTEWLGPQRFVIPVNFYKSQSGPANHGPPTDGLGSDVDLSVQWPCLEPMPPGVVASEHQALVRRAINITLDYVDPTKVSLERLMRRWISPINPDDPVQRTNPVDNLDLRLQGEPWHGLTPYYADLARVTAYFETYHPTASDRENILRNADEWYLHQGDAGYPTTIIKCPSREIPDGLLVRGNEVFDDPQHRWRASCDHRFVIPEWHLDVSVSYPRVFLPHWRRIEDRVRALLRAGYLP